MTAGGSLGRVDVASGLVFGEEPGARPLPPANRSGPRAALEAAVLRGLTRPPCLVSFSGGRDSAAVLATATHVARREGLEPPVPATNRFPEAPLADESDWQEQTVRHLGLQDWVRLSFVDELDCLGPVAQETLRRHGLLWPFNVHFHAPIVRRAAGGSVLTGAGGDEVLSASRWDRTLLLLSGRTRPQPRDLFRIGLALSPHPLRAAVFRRRLPENAFPWLTEAARDAVTRAAAAEAAHEPVGWTRRLVWMRRLRHMELAERSLETLAAGEGAQIEHPLSDRALWAELAALPRSRRFRSRTEALRLLVGDLLPDAVLERRSKASFDEAFWHGHARAFASAWDGSGVDEDVVDARVLQQEWRKPIPDSRSYLLAQALWLARARSAAAGDRVEQRRNG